MVPHCMYLFNRKGACLYYREWSRPAPPDDAREDQKLMFGFLFSLKQLVHKMTPKQCVAPCPPTASAPATRSANAHDAHPPRLSRRSKGMYSCSTSTYRLHYYETATGLRFVLLTDLAAGDMRDVLRHIYAALYVEILVKNPLWKPDENITYPSCVSQLDEYIAGLN